MGRESSDNLRGKRVMRCANPTCKRVLCAEDSNGQLFAEIRCRCGTYNDTGIEGVARVEIYSGRPAMVEGELEAERES